MKKITKNEALILTMALSKLKLHGENISLSTRIEIVKLISGMTTIDQSIRQCISLLTERCSLPETSGENNPEINKLTNALLAEEVEVRIPAIKIEELDVLIQNSEVDKISNFEMAILFGLVM